MTDLEIDLVKAFGWSLAEIDRTDIESLFPFLHRLGGHAEPTAYCDEVDWL
jgi:hypothetical protein